MPWHFIKATYQVMVDTKKLQSCTEIYLAVITALILQSYLTVNQVRPDIFT